MPAGRVAPATQLPQATHIRVVLQRASGVLEREFADLPIDPRPTDGDRSLVRPECSHDRRDRGVVQPDPTSWARSGRPRSVGPQRPVTGGATPEATQSEASQTWDASRSRHSVAAGSRGLRPSEVGSGRHGDRAARDGRRGRDPPDGSTPANSTTRSGDRQPMITSHTGAPRSPGQEAASAARGG
jgi:hypothetical protein